MLAELRRIGPEGRKHVVDDWSPFLPSYVDPALSLLEAASAQQAEHDDPEPDDDDDDQILGGEISMRLVLEICKVLHDQILGGQLSSHKV